MSNTNVGADLTKQQYAYIDDTTVWGSQAASDILA